MAPRAADTIDAGVAGVDMLGPGVVTVATAINPAAGAVVGAVVGILMGLGAAWKKWRTPLVELGNKYDRVAAGARAAADVIETVVKPNAELWEKGKPIMKKAAKRGAVNPDDVVLNPDLYL